MPAVSGKQRRAAGAALSAKQGGTPTSSLMGPAAQMMSMTEKQLKEYARRPRTTRQASGMAGKRKQGRKRGK